MGSKRLNSKIELNDYQKGCKDRLSEIKAFIQVCVGTGCRANGSMDVLYALKEEVAKRNKENDIVVKATGCHGFCEKGPLVVTLPDESFYKSVEAKNASEIIDVLLNQTNPPRHLLYLDPSTRKFYNKENEVPFYAKQQRLVFRYNGKIDPCEIDDYLARDGYSSLAKALTEMSPPQVIDEIKKSGLKGRGGAGFPTGMKWQFARNAQGEKKYIVCNGDEGDPGAFMDRSILEGTPHVVLEGMLIGAYAIGANEGYIYVRTEYPLAIQNLEMALEQAMELGLLGDNILGTDFSFHLNIFKGAGAFVCGEETALIASIEGLPGEPRPRPPFPAQSGLFGKPTNINNVETWANIPLIIEHGSEWYASIGTKSSKGTKVFSLVGKVNNTGLVEVPMGTTIREIVYDIGGGVLNKGSFKAVQIGGPSGGCIPESLIDTPIDFEELAKIGSMMGSGGLIVMDERTCMVDVAKYFLKFLESESCGKCVPCRSGIKRMLEIVDRITNGEGREGDIDLLEDMANGIKDASLCGLGQTAPNPVLTTLRFFRDEYEAHIKQKRCPAAVCKALIEYRVIEHKCTGCQRCVSVCPTGAITGPRSQLHNLDKSKCIKCGACYEICRFDAIAGDAIVLE